MNLQTIIEKNVTKGRGYLGAPQGTDSDSDFDLQIYLGEEELGQITRNPAFNLRNDFNFNLWVGKSGQIAELRKTRDYAVMSGLECKTPDQVLAIGRLSKVIRGYTLDIVERAFRGEEAAYAGFESKWKRHLEIEAEDIQRTKGNILDYLALSSARNTVQKAELKKNPSIYSDFSRQLEQDKGSNFEMLPQIRLGERAQQPETPYILDRYKQYKGF